MFGRQTARGYRENHSSTPPKRWAERMRRADLSFVNLETGLCRHSKRQTRYPLLVAPAQRLELLAALGVDAVSVANNHALDCGPHGLKQTLRELRRVNIGAAGVAPSGDLRLTVRGQQVTLLGATMHPPPYEHDQVAPLTVPSAHAGQLLQRIAAVSARRPKDLLVLSLHWGKERAPVQAIWQQRFARAAIEAGAHLIAGHGSHTAQQREQHQRGLIFYSLGNLLFDARHQLTANQPPALAEAVLEHGRWSVQPLAEKGPPP